MNHLGPRLRPCLDKSRSSRVAVVIPSYNHDKYIAQCFDSVFAQTFSDFEIFVTDDGSTDDTVEVIRQLKDPRIKFNNFSSNRGACAALNDAIRRTSSEFIAVLNSDDTFLPHKLAVQVAWLDAHPEHGAVFSYPEFIDENGSLLVGKPHKDESAFLVDNKERHCWLRHFFYKGNALCHPTILIRRSCYEHVGLYNERLAQIPDLEMWIRLTRAYDIHVIQEPLVQFRIRDGNANASGLRPASVVRDLWEWTQVLAAFRGMTLGEFSGVFGYTPTQSPDMELAHICCQTLSPTYRSFGLSLWYELLGPDGGSSAATFIAATGRFDMFNVLPPPGNFDPVRYLELNPDVAAAGMDPFRHYALFGQFEGRSCH